MTTEFVTGPDFAGKYLLNGKRLMKKGKIGGDGKIVEVESKFGKRKYTVGSI